MLGDACYKPQCWCGLFFLRLASGRWISGDGTLKLKSEGKDEDDGADEVDDEEGRHTTSALGLSC